MTKTEIKVENIVTSATIGKDLDLPQVAPALEGVEYNLEQFPGLVYKIKEPKTAALIFGSGKLVCTGAKSIEDSKRAIHIAVDKMRALDPEIPHEYEMKVQNIVASANLEKTLNLEAVALDLKTLNTNQNNFLVWFIDWVNQSSTIAIRIWKSSMYWCKNYRRRSTWC